MTAGASTLFHRRKILYILCSLFRRGLLSPDGHDIEYFYNEATVPDGHDINGTYFMLTGFAEGYMGIQSIRGENGENGNASTLFHRRKILYILCSLFRRGLLSPGYGMSRPFSTDIALNFNRLHGKRHGTGKRKPFYPGREYR